MQLECTTACCIYCNVMHADGLPFVSSLHSVTNGIISWDKLDTRATDIVYHLTILDDNSVVLYSNSTMDTSIDLLAEPHILAYVCCGRYTVRIVVETAEGGRGPGFDLRVASDDSG